jgi:hypothetical protein
MVFHHHFTDNHHERSSLLGAAVGISPLCTPHALHRQAIQPSLNAFTQPISVNGITFRLQLTRNGTSSRHQNSDGFDRCEGYLEKPSCLDGY